MKKYLSYILIGMVAAGCTTMYGPEQHPTPVVPSDGLELTLGEVKDSSVTVTIATKGEAAYYSYCVLQAEGKDAKPEVLDSVGVYTLAYEDDAVQSGTFKWTADKTSETVTVEPLDPDGYYYFYAVAGSVEGVPSAVSVLALHTTDAVAPELDEKEGFEVADSVVTLTFPEAVTYVKDVQLMAMVYAVNSPEIFQAAPIDVIPIPADSVKVDDNVVTIVVPGLPIGADYAIGLPEGTFLDSAKNKSPEVMSAMMIDPEYGQITIGVCGKVENQEFELEKLDSLYLYDLKSLKTAPVEPRDLLFTYEGEISVMYDMEFQRNTYVLEPEESVMVSDEGEIVFLPSLIVPPVYGCHISLKVEKGAFQDIFGNENKAWESSDPFYTKPFMGLYAGPTEVEGEDKPVISGLQLDPIEDKEEEEYGNCTITMINNLPALDGPVYANYFPDMDVLAVPSGQPVVNTKFGLVFLMSKSHLDTDEPNMITMELADGVLKSPSEPIVLYVDTGDPKTDFVLDELKDFTWKLQPKPEKPEK